MISSGGRLPPAERNFLYFSKYALPFVRILFAIVTAVVMPVAYLYT